LHGVTVGDDLRPVDSEPEALEAFRDQRAALVLVDAGGGAVGGRDDERAVGREQRAAGRGVECHVRLQSPDLPPVFSSTRTSVMTAPLSTALTMSITVSAATETAVRASISTPVRSVVFTVARISTASS